MPRPSKFNPVSAKRIITAVRTGTPLKHAAAIAGISYDTLNRWMNRGHRLKKGEFRKFCLDLEKAKSELIETHVKRISEAGKTTWQASAWMLERLCHETFGRKDRLEHSRAEGALGANVNVTPIIPASLLPDEHAEIAMRKLLDVPNGADITPYFLAHEEESRRSQIDRKS